MTFDFTPTDDGLRIHDTIENAWADIDLGGPVEPESASTDVFRVPLDDAVAVETTELRFDQNLGTMVRDRTGTFVDQCLIGDHQRIDSGTYELETMLSLFKLYLQPEHTALTIEDRPSGTLITFESPTVVTLGVRSHHQQPAGVVTAAQDPRDLMQAISTFGTGMKTFSPERSFPTLRGHPPELAVRGQTSIPDDFTPPDTDITVEIPPEYAAVFTSTPLAYYLGATIEPGLDARIIADGAVHEFDADSLAEDVHDLLRHCFVLDTVVRTVGIYPFDMEVGRRLDDRITLDSETLYDLPIGERTARYFDFPIEATRDLLTWPAVADIDPVPLSAEALPYLAYRMSAIRSPVAGTTRHSDCCSPDENQPSETRRDATSVRSFTPGEPDAGSSVSFVDPVPFDADHHIWVADGLPVTGSKPTLGSYLRSTEAAPRTDPIDVHVVDTGSRKREHPACVVRQYSNDGFDVTLHEDPTTSELKDVLLTDLDLLHYMGDVSNEGLECLDGSLDVRILPRTGVSAFFLDGECSYRQGLALIRVGSIGGVVTTTENRPTIEHPGQKLAALIDHGFTLAAAVDILAALADDANYTIVGDACHQICKPPYIPTVFHAQPAKSGPDSVTPRTKIYPTMSHGVGSAMEFSGVEDPLKYLAGEHDVTFRRDTFSSHADWLEAPIIADQELYWADQYTMDDLWELLQ